MGRTAKISIGITADLASEACKQAGVKVENGKVTLEASKSSDGTEHTLAYSFPVVVNRAQALSVLQGDDANIWKAVSEFLRTKARSIATLELRGEFTDQTEKSVLRSAEILWNSARTKPHAVAMVSAALSIDAAAAEAKMSAFCTKRDEVSAAAKTKREAKKTAK